MFYLSLNSIGKALCVSKKESRIFLILNDEFQNMEFHELDTLITRVGQDSKIMFAGDTAQSDLKNGNVKSA